MRVFVFGIVLLICAAWFFEHPHTLAQADILDANGNQAVGR